MTNNTLSRLNLEILDFMDRQFILENLSDEDYVSIQKDLQGMDDSRIIGIAISIIKTLAPEDLPKIRVVITANFVNSVSSRQSTGQEFDIKRGSGVVAGKTMPPNKDGVVDIILPLQFVLLGNIDDVKHVGSHEAVHAHLNLLGTRPFDVHVREKFGPAMTQFMAMAGDQVEEHLAEQISSSSSSRKNWVDSDSIGSALAAFDDALTTQLPAIPQDAEDYFTQVILITFNTFSILWKKLAFLAAELRRNDTFDVVPDEIATLSSWKSLVEPYWTEYLKILSDVPMVMDVDIQKTDVVVKELAEHLQQWSLGLGFDYHDISDSQVFFKIINP